MLQVTLLCVGTLKEKFWQDACAEYEKRLGAYCRFECIALKEERITDENNPQKIQQALFVEGSKMLSQTPEGAYRVALCVEGKSFDSVSLAKVIGAVESKSGKIALYIGSSHGLSPEVKEAANLKLSLSALTFPHQLTRVLLLESLYRSFTILKGKSYHK
ncbi:MAG: 23S rRNA (pseudouridine(1915)-N(3))-methyltransferase RlmH [Clostridia bacterium]|nr:23S rRNA (pseudouridine(1915)-N(3))-methyltransferase RlmH [Clostridia bacterium]